MSAPGAMVAMPLAPSIAVGLAWPVAGCGMGMLLLSAGALLRFTLR